MDFSKYAASPTPTASGPASAGGFSRYGTPVDLPPVDPPKQSFLSKLFGHPVEDIRKAGEAVQEAIAGQGQYEGQSALRRGFAAAESAAMAIPNVAADVVPGGRQALDAVGAATGAAVNAVGNANNTLADVAQKVGLMTPEQRKQYDENNAAFAGSPVGTAIDAAASIGQSAGNIANVILAANGVAEGTQKLLDKANDRIAASQDAKATQPAEPSPDEIRQRKLVTDTANELKGLEDKYSNTRQANDFSKDGGVSSRERIAGSGVLRYTVDENGIMRTTDPGGAVDQYKAMTVKPAEGIVRQALEQEGSKVNISEVAAQMVNQAKDSGLKGADLVTALNAIDREIEGLRLDADEKGYVPTAILQDAKINTTSNINFQTPPEVSTYRKAIGRAYRISIEENSSFNVKEVNAELGKFYDDINRLERLDGKRVSGGRLGKYTAQLSGNVVGATLGSLFGPIGSTMGAIAGGELSGLIKGKSMAGTFDKGATPTAPQSEILNRAVEAVNQTSADAGTPGMPPLAP